MAAAITIADVELLKSLRNPTGYRHVYESHRDEEAMGVFDSGHKCRGRRRLFIAKIRLNGVLIRLPGSSPTPTECARKVVAWYQERYGDSWREVLVPARRLVPTGGVS
ncbi:hypothetical protein J8F10_14340 [Gemmata sp. G18]|uniref:DUF4160 domain-containing protein n=1 Tax=Gemmata palustris TaxID=2822762 RepID=A0ABS5BS29_9BACT|nr:hypothetical protein [Gemmata palustris]MBP3956456.1 hypothetical protein [Gemmata palustris]